MDYIIVYENARKVSIGLANLERQVKGLMEMGYVTAGGVTISQDTEWDNNRYAYAKVYIICQPMVKN